MATTRPTESLLRPLPRLILLLALLPSAYCVSFYGSGPISLPLQEARSRSKISFRFKTHRSSGVFLLAAGSPDYCLITLDKGQVRVRINLGSGEAALTSKSGLNLNDLSWHRVRVDRNEAKLTLTVDGIHSTFLDIPGTFFDLNVKSGLFLGGLGDGHELFLGNLPNFRGCLEELIYNGIDVIESVSKIKHGLDEVTDDCSDEFEATSRQAISFVESGAFLSLPAFMSWTRTGGSLELEVKTSSHMALLFYVSGSPAHLADFIAVEIINGRTSLSANDGNGVVVLHSDVVVNDGFWHRIAISFSTTYLEVTVDEKTRTLRPSLGENRFFDLSGDLFVGGIESKREYDALQQGLQSVLSEGPESSLMGCIRELTINQKAMGISEARITRGLKAGGCFWEFPCLADRPCIPGSECFQEGLDDFQCLCDINICVKPNYTDHYKTLNFKASTPSVKTNLSLNPVVSRDMSYLNITIKSGHLIVTGIVVCICLVICLFVALMREFYLLHQKSQRSRKEQQAANMSVTGSPTPIGSDYEGDLVTISSRGHLHPSCSSQGTPSVSEVETSCLPASQSQSQSQSHGLGATNSCGSHVHVNCSDHLQNRSITPTRTYQRTLQPNNLQFRAVIEDGNEPRGDNIYPLPPPSLYFGSESGSEAVAGGRCCLFTSTPRPTCKVTSPIGSHFSRDCSSGAYSRWMGTIDLSSGGRALGDGTSASGTPLPSLKRVPWSSEDLYRACTSCPTHEHADQFNFNCQPSADCRVFPPKGLVCNNHSDQLPPRFQPPMSSRTPMPMRRQQYWV